MLGLSEDHSAMVLTLASSTTDTSTDNNISLLGLVSQAMSFVRTTGSIARKNVGALTILPCAPVDEEEETVRHGLAGRNICRTAKAVQTNRLTREAKSGGRHFACDAIALPYTCSNPSFLSFRECKLSVVVNRLPSNAVTQI